MVQEMSGILRLGFAEDVNHLLSRGNAASALFKACDLIWSDLFISSIIYFIVTF